MTGARVEVGALVASGTVVGEPMLEAAGYLTLLVLTLAALVVGFVIVFQAYRGYRRSGSEPMRWLALGLFLLTVVPFVLSVAVTSVASELDAGRLAFVYGLPIASRLVELAGLCCILYSLYMRSS